MKNALVTLVLALVGFGCSEATPITVVVAPDTHSLSQVELLQGVWVAPADNGCIERWTFSGANYTQAVVCQDVAGNGIDTMMQSGSFQVGNHYDGRNALTFNTQSTTCPAAGQYDGTSGPAFYDDPYTLTLVWTDSTDVFTRDNDGYAFGTSVESGCFVDGSFSPNK